ncbi:hypothetical protein PCH_Pc17g00840 [Penicillium rubens Wisconsin 54-1255]|uniref:Uncharacterized protein n=1 Tax=Penicillium rubens (strain ATCC 28089 / DSM 1075 / NRRL 1951 / Wisconsin 54-1255) TaxID=500485 RepID=B6HB04_PENRW|nr:hypothetical protein PCH_Pc17g00840 [Penicillium rubens Wisconsin 54-1255]
MVDCINLDTTSKKAIAVTSIRDWLKYDPSLPRHSRSQPGILDCLLVQISQQHGCLCAYRMANFTQAIRSAPHHMLLHVGLGRIASWAYCLVIVEPVDLLSLSD